MNSLELCVSGALWIDLVSTAIPQIASRKKLPSLSTEDSILSCRDRPEHPTELL